MGPNVHVIGAISINGRELIQIRRGAFKWVSANAFLDRVIDQLLAQIVPNNRIAIICNNEPVHARFEQVGIEKDFASWAVFSYAKSRRKYMV